MSVTHSMCVCMGSLSTIYRWFSAGLQYLQWFHLRLFPGYCPISQHAYDQEAHLALSVLLKTLFISSSSKCLTYISETKWTQLRTYVEVYIIYWILPSVYCKKRCLNIYFLLLYMIVRFTNNCTRITQTRLLSQSVITKGVSKWLV